MFTLKNGLAFDQANDLDDTSNIKLALTALGYHDDTDEGLSSYPTEKLFTSIKSFQKDNSLKVDGIIKPDGPTQAKIKDRLEKDKSALESLTIFKNRRQDMIDANTIDADKYFHCLANYESTSLGTGGEINAHGLSAAREVYGFFKGDGLTAIKDDLKANKHGREGAKSGKYKSAQEACAIFRPKGLDEKY